MSNPNLPRVISTNEQLAELCQKLTNIEWLAVDTEFLRERTYHPRFCLLQVATPEQAFCIDPLCISDMNPIMELMLDPRITKVFHAARQDLEIFFSLTGKVPAPIFDTQIAAPLLGFAEQIGYANLVLDITGVQLDKSHTRTDWSLRPLDEKQIDYALADVVYLAQIYPLLLARLQEGKRLDWLKEDFKELESPLLYKPAPERAWLKIRPLQKMKGKQLAVSQHLAAWREDKAQKTNQPRNWILKDDALTAIAQILPKSIHDLEKIRGLSQGLRSKFGKEILELIEAGKNSKPLPRPKMPEKKSHQQEAIIDFMNTVVRLQAIEHGLAPAVLASRKDLELLLTSPEDSRLSHGWRHELAGQALRDILAGKKSLSITDGKVKMWENTP